jgi:hypothetical protein
MGGGKANAKREGKPKAARPIIRFGFPEGFPGRVGGPPGNPGRGFQKVLTGDSFPLK